MADGEARSPSKGKNHKKEKRASHINLTMKGREDIFRDFERFLQTEKIMLVDLRADEMNQRYTKDYRAYKHQIAPDEMLPSFGDVKAMLRQKGIGHFENDLFYWGPSPRTNEPKNTYRDLASRGKGSAGAARDRTAKPDEVIYSRTERKRQLRTEMYRIAVDQHLTTKSSHVQSPINKQLYRALPAKPDPSDSSVTEEFAKYVQIQKQCHVCTICQVRCQSHEAVMQHLAGKKHRVTVSVFLLKKKRPEMIKSVHGIDVTSNLSGEDGTFEIKTEPGEVIQSDLTITNNGTAVAEFLHCEQMKTMRVFTFNDSKKVTDGYGSRVLLRPGESYEIQLRTKADSVGTYHSAVVFKFNLYDPTSSALLESCFLVRYLMARCTNSIVEELRPSAPFKKPPRVAKPRGKAVPIEAGHRYLKGSSSDGLERVVSLNQFKVPDDLRKLINRGLTNEAHLDEGEKVELNNLRSILELPLSMDVYRRRFDALLYLEEVQMEVDIRKYDMEGVCLKGYPSNKRLLALEVPGLCENRPSVLRGDCLFVRSIGPGGHLGNMEYEGFVHDIQLNDVALGFSERFRKEWIANTKYVVRFRFNRFPMRLQHRSCQLADDSKLGPLLFPKGLQKKEITLPKLKLYNRELEKNEKQLCAVQHIVAGTSCPAPYIIFGPPGTGKTVTVVEAIKQVWKSSGTTHILACTPSNSAADLITSRLMQHVDKKDIIRLNAASRSWSSIPDTIKDICNYDQMKGEYYFPRKTELMGYRIIVTTMVTAGRLASAKFPTDHFTHVFIDEGGHAVEPEAVIGLAGIMDSSNLLKGTAQVVIAGDPKQLGPVLRSPLAIDYGLDISLLERLMISCDLYQPMTVDDHKRYDVRAITKLLKNYRSHPEILKLPNNMFYDSELEACANPIVREKLCKWEGLPKPGFPVVFHSVMGADMREERSPSFFNAEEVSVVIKYAQDLLSCKKGGMKIKPEEIGIVTPYRKQVDKIKRVLRQKHLDNITVGSVEEFQGQERTVIIVSTVRSKPEYLSLDLTYNLGFLRNPKRFNVTVTRAKALLVVIGNPNTLSKDPHWKQLIEFCENAGSYKGIERMTEDEETEDIIQRLNAVGIIDENLNLVPEVRADYNEQAWRGDL